MLKKTYTLYNSRTFQNSKTLRIMQKGALLLFLRRTTIVCLSLLCALHLNASPVDTLLTSFGKQPNVNDANSFFDYLLQEEFIDDQLLLTPTTSHDSLCATTYYWAAEWYYDIQNFKVAEQYALQSLPLCQAVGDKSMEADCASLISLIYVRLSAFDKAAVYAKQCNELDLESGNNDNIASSYNTLAGIYMTMRQVDEAERYILKAIEYVNKVDNPARKAVIYGMASEVYQHKNQPEKTLEYATRAWNIENQLGRIDKAAIRQTERAAALISLERYKEAEEILTQAIPIIEQSGNIHSLGIAYNHMGDLLYVQGRNQEGAEYYYKALDIFIAQHDLYNESHTRKGLRETLRGINPEEALLHGDRFEHLRDSIYDDETNKNLSQYAAQYQNDILQQINSRQRIRYIWLIVLVVVLFMLLAFVTWLIYKKQQKHQLQHFNDLLSEVDKLRSISQARKNIDNLRENTSEDLNATDADYRLMLARVVELVSDGLIKGEYSVEHIAEAMNMSVSTFRRRMLAATGDSPKNFILAIQMEKAAELLVQNTEMPIADIALHCGFSEAGSFTRTFRRFYGITPSQYREQNKA